MATHVRSYSKINLGLAVGPARADGFHGLTTLYQTLALHDVVTVRAERGAATKVLLGSNHPAVPSTRRGDAERNTAYRMVWGALARMGVTARVEIEIEKRLPIQGGMGAGSANAVAALLGLERELGLALPGPERMELAAAVGSDVPLFLLGGSVLGLGRGEEVYPLADLPRTWCCVAMPKVGVSTALAFKELDQKQGTGEQGTGNGEQGAGEQGTGEQGRGESRSEGAALTFAQPPDRLRELSRVLASAFMVDGRGTGPSGIGRSLSQEATANDLAEDPLLALVRTGIENDFQEVAFSQHPFLRDILRELKGTSVADGAALYAALSGSGSALFGLYADRAGAEAAQQRVQQAGTQALVSETLPRTAYWRDMFAE